MSIPTGPNVWNWSALCEDVQALYGRRAVADVKASAGTVTRRLRHCHYHFSEMRRLVAADLEGRDGAAVVTDFIFAADEDAYADFHERRADAEAHLIALLQGIHAIPDPMAHVIYFSLGLDRVPRLPLSDRGISMPSVFKRLREGDLKAAIKRMDEEPDLRHLDAAVNLGKHRTLLEVPVSVDFTGNDPQSHGLVFAAFQHDGKPYPKKAVEPFIKAAFERQARYVVDIGNLVNAEVARRRACLAHSAIPQAIESAVGSECPDA